MPTIGFVLISRIGLLTFSSELTLFSSKILTLMRFVLFDLIS